MPKYKFERNTNRGLIIDKLSFASSNKSQDFASGLLKDDPELMEVVITQIDPKDPLHGRVTIDRLVEKIYFVGIHHKPGMKPLDSRTATGIIIDSVACQLEADTEKLNLFPQDNIPEDAAFWVDKFISDMDHNAVFVLLGKQVQKYLASLIPNSILVNHPAYYKRRGKDAVNDYVRGLVNILNEKTKV